MEAIALDPSDPETIYVGSVGAGRGSGISMSTDRGRTWHPVGLRGTNVFALAVDPQHAGILYAGTPKGLPKTSDGGSTRRAGGLESFVSQIKIDPKRRRLSTQPRAPASKRAPMAVEAGAPSTRAGKGGMESTR